MGPGVVVSASRPTRPQLWLQPLLEQPPAPLSPQEQRWCAALPEGLQGRYGRSRSQLRACLAAVLQCSPEQVPLHSPPAQAPQLGQGCGHVSLSHSRQQLLMAWSPWPIGVDLEWAARPLLAEAVARRFFPEAEWQRLQGLPTEALRGAVLASWVRKEAAIKWHRGSIAHDLCHWLWDGNRGGLQHLQRGWQPPSVLHLHDGWCCAVVGEAVEQAQWA